MRTFIRECILDGLGMLSYPANSVHILNGHMISRKPADLLSQKNFYSQLKELRKYVQFINVKDAINLIQNRENVDYPLVAFTFDDGFMDCHSMIAPVLEDFGVNAAFFINPNFADGDEDYILNFTEKTVLTPGKYPMTWTEIEDLHRRGHIIGAHTMDHYMINDSDVERLEYQIGACKSVIENKLFAPCEYFAFPYGRLEHANKKSIDIACKYYPYIFSQSDYKHYFSFDNRAINRRHFEPFWPVNHVKYFLSHTKK